MSVASSTKKIIQLNHRSYYLLSMHSYNPIIFPLSISPITPPVSQWTLQRPPPLSAYPMLSTKFSLPLCLPLYICLSFSLSISQSLSLSVSLFLSIHEASHYVIEACATLPLCPWSYLTSSFLSCSSLDLPNLLTGHYIISFTLVDTWVLTPIIPYICASELRWYAGHMLTTMFTHQT